MTCGIYMIKNKKTGQKYIGQSINIEKRWKDHCYGYDKKNSYIDNSIQKYGSDIFELSIIYECENDMELLNELEKYYIWKYNTFEDKNHYNLTPGGDFNPAKVPEIAKKISKSKIGCRNPNYNKIMSYEQKQKISKTMKKYTQNNEFQIRCSKKKNTSGYFRVCKETNKSCKQGFIYLYQYQENGKQYKIRSVDIRKLEQKVKCKKLPWIKFD